MGVYPFGWGGTHHHLEIRSGFFTGTAANRSTGPSSWPNAASSLCLLAVSSCMLRSWLPSRVQVLTTHVMYDFTATRCAGGPPRLPECIDRRPRYVRAADSAPRAPA